MPSPTKRELLQAMSMMAAASPLFGASAASAGEAAGRVRKVALEEHFLLPGFEDYFRKIQLPEPIFQRLAPVLLDFDDRRISTMDAHGIDFSVLSLAGPGVQAEPDTALAIRLARQANDRLAAEVQKRPKRYGGFAHLPLQDPRAAADELERCVRDLGFHGALINGQTLGVYLDDRRYDVFWERVSDLDRPIYLHPAHPMDRAQVYAGHPEMWGAVYSWGAETCAHALRLIFSGTFDRFPKVQLILGHMGETLPVQLWRLDSRYPLVTHATEIAHLPSYYVRKNIRMTTSGVCADVALRAAIDAVGVDNILFSIDYPFESTEVASKWISSAKIDASERARICHENAERILHIA